MPTTRVLHLSDLHYGAGNDEAIERGAPVLTERFQPELGIASGDLSHRGREDQLARSSNFLRSLDRPVLAVPGNHDIPYRFPARVERPVRQLEGPRDATEPTHSSTPPSAGGLDAVLP